MSGGQSERPSADELAAIALQDFNHLVVEVAGLS